MLNTDKVPGKCRAQHPAEPADSSPMPAERARTPIRKSRFCLPGDVPAARLDQALPRYIEGLSRLSAKKFMDIGAVWVNGRRVLAHSWRVSAGDEVVLYRGREGFRKYYELDPANILYEDDWILCYRKEPGIPTQGLVCDSYNNLHAAVLRHLRKKTAAPYAGLHHRLDSETSGVVILTTSTRANRGIHSQFQARTIKKSYLALVAGKPDFEEQTLHTYISRQPGRYCCSARGPGKEAITHFRAVKECGNCTLVQARPETGRTHQIRLQLAFLGLPVLGDRLYGQGSGQHAARAMLHAAALSFVHPASNQELTVEAELFDDMRLLVG